MENGTDAPASLTMRAAELGREYDPAVPSGAQSGSVMIVDRRVWQINGICKVELIERLDVGEKIAESLRGMIFDVVHQNARLVARKRAKSVKNVLFPIDRIAPIIAVDVVTE